MIDRRNFIASAAAIPVAGAFASHAAAKTAPASPGPEMTRFIAGLPKAEMHLHLEGTLEAQMKFAIAKRNGIKLPYASVAEMKQSYIYHDLPSFLKIYYEGASVLQKEQDYFDLCYAYLAKAHSQNVLYTEMFFDPQQHMDRGIGLDQVIPGFTRARAEAEKDLGVKSKLIMCFMRELTAESAAKAYDASLPFQKDLVAVGLDSDEKGNPPDKFRDVFMKARAAGLKVTAHCDIDQENTLEHIRRALDELKADRIDHGGNILQSPELVAKAKARNMAFTVCPVFSGWLKNPDGTRTNVLRGMLDAGLKASLNSDDPAYMAGNYMNESFAQAQKDSNLSAAEMVRISRNAFEAAWITPEERAGFMAQLDAYAREWGVAA